jgi:hypothetical protein
MNADDATAHDDIKAKLLLSDEDLFAEVGQSLGKGATFTDAIKRAGRFSRTSSASSGKRSVQTQK